MKQQMMNRNERGGITKALFVFLLCFVCMKGVGEVAHQERSLKDLRKEAAKSGFNMNDKGATASYLEFLKAEAVDGDRKEVEKAAVELIKRAAGTEGSATRMAALDVLSVLATDRMYIDLLKYMQKAPSETKTDILIWTGKEAGSSADKKKLLQELELRFDLTAIQAINQQIGKGEKEVTIAAIKTLAAIEHPSVIPILATLLSDPDEEIISICGEALAGFEGNIASAVARTIPAATDPGKITAVNLLAERKANQHVNTVFELIRSGSHPVKIASYKALKHLVGYRDFVYVCGLLESADQEFIPLLQEVVISTLSSLPDTEKVEVIKKRMLQAGESNKHLYLPVLSAIGLPDALTLIPEEDSRKHI